jgi:hypothetical protein
MSSRRGRAGGAVSLAVGAIVLGAVLFGHNAAESDTSTRNASGTITEAGDVGVMKLHVGDCLPASALGDEPDPDSEAKEGQTFQSMAAVPCDEPHVAEVALVDDTFFEDGEKKMPSSDEMQKRLEQPCISAVEDYTGESFEESSYDLFTLIPTLDSWALKDRGAVCVAVNLDENLEGYEETEKSFRV